MSGNGSFDHARPPFVVIQKVADGGEGEPTEPAAMHISAVGQAKGQRPTGPRSLWATRRRVVQFFPPSTVLMTELPFVAQHSPRRRALERLPQVLNRHH